MNDAELGDMSWNAELNWWEGAIQLSSPKNFHLYVLARDVPNRAITENARAAIDRLRKREVACRQYAATKLLAIHNDEWAKDNPITADDFVKRLVPDSIEVHESGYAEVHFGAGEMFSGHGVGVRIREDGSFQEAVLEG